MKTVSVTIFIACLLGASHLFAREISQDTLPDNHLLFVLQRIDSSFVGASEYLEGFEVSVDLPREFMHRDVSDDDLLSVIGSENVTGVFRYPNGKTTPIEYDIVDHRGKDDVYMKTRQGYFLWESLRIDNDTLEFVIDWWYCPPATEADIRIIEMAESLLADSSKWNREDDRQCEDDIETDNWSLFCSLKHASITVTGEYNHHNTAMQAVRAEIDSMIPGNEFQHPLMDFNNSTTTGHTDILQVLDRAKSKIKQQIE